MSVSVVIPVTRVSEVQVCVEKLVRSFQLAHVMDYEIILIKDPQCDLNFSNFIGNSCVRIFDCESMHPSIRRNYGVKLSSHCFVAFIDDDVYVPDNWVANVLKSIVNCDGVCGPIIQSRFKSPLKNIVGLAQESFFSEGFNDHRNFRSRTRFFDIPLCNVVIRRQVWDAVHGFNEVADYNVDDCEFFFLAERKGFQFFNEPGLAVEHDLMPLGWLFVRKKIHQRFKGGINSMIFKEIYFLYASVRIVWLSYLILFLLLSGQLLHSIQLGPLTRFITILYIILAISFSMTKAKKNLPIAFALPFVFFLIHIIDYFSYTAGVIYYFICRNRFHLVLEHKRRRMAYYATEI